MPSRRSPATSVVVFRWPCGTLMRSRSPPRLWVRAMFVAVHRAFAEPIGAAETIARTTAQLAVSLCAALDRRGLGARRLDLVFTLVDAGTVAIRVGVSRPSQDHRHLTRLLCARIETIDPGFGVERMRLSAPLTEPAPCRQTVTISDLAGEPARDLSDLIDTLANRLGARRVYRFAPVESDVPERAVRRIDPLQKLAPPPRTERPPPSPSL